MQEAAIMLIYLRSSIGRPLKTTFDMTTLIFSAGGCPWYPFIPLKGALGTLFSWLVTENPSREVATKDHFASGCGGCCILPFAVLCGDHRMN